MSPKSSSVRHVVNRRHFLRAAGVSMALPLFESLGAREDAPGRLRIRFEQPRLPEMCARQVQGRRAAPPL